MEKTTIKDKLTAGLIVILASVGIFTILYAGIIGAKNTHTYFTEEKRISIQSSDFIASSQELEARVDTTEKYILEDKCKEMGGEYKEEGTIVVANSVLSFYKDHCKVGGKKYIGNFEQLHWVQIAEPVDYKFN